MKKYLDFTKLQEKLSGLTMVQKVLLFAATFILIGTAFYFLKYQEQLDNIQRLRITLTEQEQRLASLKAAAARVDLLEKELAKAEEELSVLMTLLPDQKEIPGLLENVSRLGSRVGLENILFQPKPEVPQELYATIPINLDLVGTFNDVGVFLDNISKLNRILKVEAISLVRLRDKPLLQVTCTVVTYRFLDKQEAKPGVPPAPAPAKK